MLTDAENENTLLRCLNDHFAKQLGLHFPHDRMRDFKRNFKSVAQSFAMEPLDCARWLLGGPLTKEQINVIAYHYTIGETYFFRDPKTLSILENEILRPLVNSRRQSNKSLRIWSAGCCTGEEPYSVAIALSRLIPDIAAWKISLMASDINPEFIKKAKKGVYKDWSFRSAAHDIKDKYFTDIGGGRVELVPRIKDMVTFMQMNLVDAHRLPQELTASVDLIFCRNVLMYFHPQQIDLVLKRLRSALSDDGYLVVSPAETLLLPHGLFFPVQIEGAPIFAKRKISSNFSSVGFEPAKAKSYVSSELIAPANKSDLALDYTFDISFAPKMADRPADPMAPYLTPPHASLTPSAKAMEPSPVPATPVVHDAHQTLHAKKLFDEGRYQECLEHLIKIGSSESADPMHLTLLARAYSNEGNLNAALNWIEKAILHDKLNQALYFVRATILQALDNLPEAISSLRKALFLDPNFVVAEFHLATLLHQTGKDTEAEKRFQNALKLLKKFGRDEIVPESDGITAGRLTQIVEGLMAETKKKI